MDSSQNNDQQESPPPNEQQQPQQQHVILFYKYHPLSDDPAVTDDYRLALHDLCHSLQLTGRILVGCSSTSEGINGTLAGSYGGVRAFTIALSESSPPLEDDDKNEGGAADGALLDDRTSIDDPDDREAVRRYRDASRAFFGRISCPVLALEPDEFKWSAVQTNGGGGGGDDGDLPRGSGPSLFPDLHVKLVDELIGSGGVMKDVPIDETARGYLTPEQWHDQVSRRDPQTSVLIDCRNHKEYEIGHFQSAVNPQTTTYSQFPHWVERNQHVMENKTVYMYCTGGVRCEKSAAYIRRVVPSAVGVHHLQGGIHKYLERYGGAEPRGGDGSGPEKEPLWRGRNFVFDGRGAASAEETYLGRDGLSKSDPSPKSPPATRPAVVGRCSHCDKPFDRFDPHCVCTVCREPTLVCTTCQEVLVEFHCRQHQRLRHCYFFDLSRFSVSDLEQQIQDLHSALAEIAVGKRFKSKRKTLMRQIAKVHNQVSLLRAQERDATTSPKGLPPCRNCGDLECSGRCWGYYGLKRKQLLEHRSSKDDELVCTSENGAKQARISEPSNLAIASINPTVQKKGRNRQDEIDEIVALGLSRPPSEHRDARTGLRVVPPVARAVHCRAKGKWCGRLAVQVLKEEFAELSRPGVLNELLEMGLLRVNGTPLDVSSSCHVRVRMQDTLSRIVHWHEPPVRVPESIPVQRLRLDGSVLRGYGLDPGVDVLFVVDKPASVPVHPAGPYLANSLALMVEAQEGLSPTTLVPLHRTDRATSGLTLFATNPAVSRIFHKSLSVPGAVHKLYLAKVCGRLWSRDEGAAPALPIGSCRWLNDRVLRVDAPVETTDPANGVRSVTLQGKPSASLFQPVSYDAATDTSLVACVPVTGRSHQLRVHLQLLHCPVLGDAQYGGRPWDESVVEEEVTTNLLLQSAFPATTEDKSSREQRHAAPSLTDADVVSARGACRVCRRLVEVKEARLDPAASSTTKDDVGNNRDDDNDNDISNSAIFSAAQLLRGGHAIALHALRYRVNMYGPRSSAKKKTKDETARDASGSSQPRHEGMPAPPTASSPAPRTDDAGEEAPLWACDARVEPPSWWAADGRRHHRRHSLDLDALFDDLSALAGARS